MCDKFKVCIPSERDGYANIQTMWNVSFDKTWSYWNFLEYLFFVNANICMTALFKISILGSFQLNDLRTFEL